jgi:hypothetical protein
MAEEGQAERKESPATPSWLTSALIVAVVSLVGFALLAGLVRGWATVAALMLAVIVVLGTAASPDCRSLATQLLRSLERRTPPPGP